MDPVLEAVKAASRTLEQMPAVDWSSWDAMHLVRAQSILREIARRLELTEPDLADLDRGLGVAHYELDKLRLWSNRGPTLDAVVQAMRHVRQAHEAI